MTDSATVLSIKNLSKVYKRSHLGRTTVHRGIDEISFDVKAGEVFGLLGLNGSGKTTTLKLVLGLLFPTKGEISIFGNPTPHPESQKRLGYLPEVPYFYRNLNPEEVLTFYAELSQLVPSHIKTRVDEVIRLVRLDHARKRAMREFSKGMLQRVALAQALIHNPEFLVLDEPMTGLDPLGIRQFRELFFELNQKKGVSILISSHSLSELEKLAHRVGVLIDGRLVTVLDRSQWAQSPGKLEEIFIQTLERHGATSNA
ncbi:MAG: ABC transporter ATP-binding protein [Elusimicrobiota bacterium]